MAGRYRRANARGQLILHRPLITLRCEAADDFCRQRLRECREVEMVEPSCLGVSRALSGKMLSHMSDALHKERTSRMDLRTFGA